MAPLELRMSRSSPGRYSASRFREERVRRPRLRARRARAADDAPGSVRVADQRTRRQRDRSDTKSTAIASTARTSRSTRHTRTSTCPPRSCGRAAWTSVPSTLTFEPPPGTAWQVATQLHPGTTAFEFTAPNLQYLMDSPTEVGPIAIRQFSVGSRRFPLRRSPHGHRRRADGFVKAVEQIVGQEGAIFGEYPDYEPGYYTFIADYLPYATGDGMEHRNSTILTSPSSIAGNRADLLDAVAHEFFHSWNVERIRPRSPRAVRLRSRQSVGRAVARRRFHAVLRSRWSLERAGLIDVTSTARTFGELVDTVAIQRRPSGALARGDEPHGAVHGRRPSDRSHELVADRHLVLSVRRRDRAGARSCRCADAPDSQVTLDDFMRAMWRKYGKPGGTREGYVDHPYTIADAEDTLAEVSGDRAFAHDFFSRYIQGRDLPDFARLLERAGLRLRKRATGRAWLGDITFAPGRLKVAALVAPTWPVYQHGPRAGRRSGAAGQSGDANGRGRRGGARRATSPAIASRSCSAIAPAARRRPASRWQRIRMWKWCRSS